MIDNDKYFPAALCEPKPDPTWIKRSDHTRIYKTDDQSTMRSTWLQRTLRPETYVVPNKPIQVRVGGMIWNRATSFPPSIGEWFWENSKLTIGASSLGGILETFYDK